MDKNLAEFRAAVEGVRAELERFGDPFTIVLGPAGAPPGHLRDRSERRDRRAEGHLAGQRDRLDGRRQHARAGRSGPCSRGRPRWARDDRSVCGGARRGVHGGCGGNQHGHRGGSREVRVRHRSRQAERQHDHHHVMGNADDPEEVARQVAEAVNEKLGRASSFDEQVRGS